MRLLAILPLLALAACVEPVAPPAAEPAPDLCNATALQGLVGQPVEVLAAMTFPIGTRQIGPDDAVTSDFRPERLNIEHGRAGRIEKVSCY